MQDSDENYLKPLIGIEFGTEKGGWDQMSKKHLENDLKKVIECHSGYIINIMRNVNFSTRSSGRNTEKQIRIKKFMDALNQYAQAHRSVTWIGMVIDIALAEVIVLSRSYEWLSFDLPRQQVDFENAVREKFIRLRADADVLPRQESFASLAHTNPTRQRGL